MAIYIAFRPGLENMIISLQNLQKGRIPRMFSWANNFDDCYFNLNNFISKNDINNRVLEVNNNFLCSIFKRYKNYFIYDSFYGFNYSNLFL